MNTCYSCAICNTKPDQISHHKSHLQTQKHHDKRANYEKELHYFSIFKTIHPNDWLQHDEIKDIIRKEYGVELTAENKFDIMLEKMYSIVEKFIEYKPEKIFCRVIDGKPTNIYVDQVTLYQEETGNTMNNNRDAYCEWCIERILQSKETIKDTRKIINTDIRDARRSENIQRMQLARYTTTNYKVLCDIRMNKLDIEYFKHFGNFRRGLSYIEKPEYLNDTILQYACVLFNVFGIISMNSLLQQESVDEYLYFYKEVEIETIVNMVNVEGYEKKTKMNKKVWVKTKSLNDDYEGGYDPKFTYVEDEVIRQKFRDYLIKFFTDRKEAFLRAIHAEYQPQITIVPRDEEDIKYLEDYKKKWYECQANIKAGLPEFEKDAKKVNKLLLDSDVFRNVMKLCEFFFEYKEEIIDQYFCNGCNFEDEEFGLEDS